MITYDSNYPDIMNVDEVCEYLSISRTTCLRLLKEKRIKGFKINQGRAWKICKPLLHQYVQSARANNYRY